MSSAERPPLRVVISDPRAGDKVVKVKVLGDDSLNYTEDMRKDKNKERTALPPAKVGRKLAEELRLTEVGVMTLRFRGEGGKKTNVPFKVQVDESLGDYEVKVPLALLGEVAGATEAEAEAFRAKAWQIAVPDSVHVRLAGLAIGDVFDGALVGLDGVRLLIRGGSDATGIPMHPGIPGAGKRRVILSGPPGFRPRERGERRRKLVRGRVIPDPRGEARKTALAQLNVVIHYGGEGR